MSDTKGPAIRADHHAHGFLADTPLTLIAMVIVCVVAYIIFSMLQITSTEQAVFGLLQVGIQLKPGQTAQQALDFANGLIDRNQTIADAIGWSVQIALTLISFPPDSALLTIHRRHNADPSPSLVRVAAAYVKWQTLLRWILIGGDVCTDFYYVVQGHTILTPVWWIIPWFSSASAFGIVIVGLVYPAAICYVTVFVGKYLFVFLEALLLKVFSLFASAS